MRLRRSHHRRHERALRQQHQQNHPPRRAGHVQLPRRLRAANAPANRDRHLGNSDIDHFRPGRCRQEESEAQKQGGRAVVTPFSLGESPANGLYFVMTVVMGVFFLHGLIVSLAAAYTWKYNEKPMIELDPESASEPLFLNPEDFDSEII